MSIQTPSRMLHVILRHHQLSDTAIGKLTDFLEPGDTTTPSQDVTSMSHDTLVEHAVDLEARLSEANAKIRKLEDQLNKQSKTTNAPANNSSESTLTKEQVREKADKLADVARREIKKQMKWVPSCKRGTAKWSYTASVPNESVLYRIFRLTADPKGKKWKQKKLPVVDFERGVGSIEASIRYG